MKALQDLKEQVCSCNLDLYNKGLVIQTFGNVSGIDRQRGIIAIKPSGIKYQDLTPDNMVLVDLDNRIMNSEYYNPSSDTKTHLELYKAFPNIGGVAHTHSPFATAWAQARRPIPCLGTTHADYSAVEIPCTEDLSDSQIGGDYETETGKQISKRFSNLSADELGMVLVSCHGPFTWGKHPIDAVNNSVILEEISKISFYTVLLNPKIDEIQKPLIDKHFNRKHGKGSYYGQKKYGC